VRHRQYLVEAVHPPREPKQMTRVCLVCLDDDDQGRPLEVLWELELGARRLDPSRHGLGEVTSLDPPRQFAAYLHAIKWSCVTATNARLFQAPFRAGIQIFQHQLTPLRKALELPRANLFIADDVGLGKTIEAGLVMAELIARRRAHRILIVSPAGPLLDQWHREMRERFGLRFEAIRGAGDLLEIQRSLVLGANPFDHVSYCLTSVDFAKQEKVLQSIERSSWDLVVIDEAHHCVRLGTAGDWEDSRRRRLAEVLARQTDALLLLTATPHDGFDAHFASIVELLDPSLVDGKGLLRGERYRQHLVRRLKQHIKDPQTGEPLFKTRLVTPLAVEFNRDSSPAFSLFQQALVAAVAPRLRQAVRQRRFGEVLAFIALLKRSVSTVAACRNTLGVIRDRYVEMAGRRESEGEARRQRLRTLRDY
jgi:hypothetical protein